MRRKPYEVSCKACGRRLVSASPARTYCDDACRQAESRWRRRRPGQQELIRRIADLRRSLRVHINHLRRIGGRR